MVTVKLLLVPLAVLLVAVMAVRLAPGDMVTECELSTPLTNAAVVPEPAVKVVNEEMVAVPVKEVTVLL